MASLASRWTYVEPGADGLTPVYTTLTDEQILTHYWPWWSAQMLRAGKLLCATEACCIEDFVVVHWAWRT
jgi:hypothetical protein